MLKYINKTKNILNFKKSLPNFRDQFKSVSFIKLKFANFAEEEKTASSKSKSGNQNSLEQERESWGHFLQFMLKREQYTWEDYLQQIIVKYF